MTQETCKKCGQEARQGTTPWGANCWREYRANRKRNAQTEQTQTEPVTSEQSVTGAVREVLSRRGYGAKRIAELEAEVAHLKRQLAERAGAAGRLTLSPATAAAMGEFVRQAECIHGGRYGLCRKLGCRPR